MNKKFVSGFWNYVPSKTIDERQAAADWAELGMNLPMSCYCDGSDEDCRYILKSLDEAHKRGMRLIVCDKRTLWKNLSDKGEAAFRADVALAAASFAAHPAFYAFHVGDEPSLAEWETMINAVRIVGEYATPFVNFLPYFEEDFIKTLGTTHDGYSEMLADAVKLTGLKRLCYDCYFQMFENERDEGIEYYFYNLNNYRRVAKQANVDFWTTLLSVGHWSYRVPTEDDIRWQIYTAAAHGAKGIFWFYIYGRLLESNYRLSPFDQYYNKTETYGRLARQMHLFNDHFADRLANSELLEVFHVGKTYGGTPLYTPACIEGLDLERKWKRPMIVSHFKDDFGKEFLFLVNNSQTEIETVSVKYFGKGFLLRFAPGQAHVIERE